MRQVVADELRKVKDTYADRRRTQIVQLGAGMKLTSQVLSATDLVPEQSVWVSVTAEGLISRSIDEKPPRMSGSAAPRRVFFSGVFQQVEVSFPGCHPEPDEPDAGVAQDRREPLRRGRDHRGSPSGRSAKRKGAA